MSGLSGIAAPLLAAAAVTVIGVIVQEPSSLKWPSGALFMLSVSAAALVASVNASIWASYYRAERIKDDFNVTDLPPQDPSLSADVAAAEDRFRAYRYWVDVTKGTHLVGVYSLWVGVGLALVPHRWTWWRVAALVAVATAILLDNLFVALAPKAAEEPAEWLVDS